MTPDRDGGLRLIAIIIVALLALTALACEESGPSITARFDGPQPEPALTQEFISPILLAGSAACVAFGEAFQDRGFTCHVRVEGADEIMCITPFGSLASSCWIPIYARIWFCIGSEVTDEIICLDEEEGLECEVPARGDVTCRPQ